MATEITLEQIAEAVRTKPLDDARAEFAGSEAIINISGAVLKVISRDVGTVRLFVQTTEPPDKPFSIFANFTDFNQQSKIKGAKIRKGSTVSFSGMLRSFGETAVVLIDCQIKTERQPIKRAAKPASRKLAKTSKKKMNRKPAKIAEKGV